MGRITYLSGKPRGRSYC